MGTNRNFEEFIHHVKSMGFSPKTVIDVGVCYGTPEIQNNFPLSFHILVEPLVELEGRLQELLKKFDGEYHLVAAGSEDTEMKLTIPANGIASATLATRPNMAEKSRTVPVKKLDSIISRNVQDPILLKTDCQGFDLNVIKGATQILQKTELVIMETNLFHPASDFSLADFGDIVVAMKARGWAVYDIISYQTRPLDSALGYVDVAFVKETGMFRRTHRWA